MAPRPAPDKHRAHPDRPGRQDVIVEAVTHIQNALSRNARFGDQPDEELGIWLSHTPRHRGSDEVSLQSGRYEHLLDGRRLVTGDADGQPHPARSRDTFQSIGIQITMNWVQTNYGAVDTENIPEIVMTSASGDHGSQHTTQSQRRHAQPLRKLGPYPSFIDQRLTDVERHASDLRQEP